MPIVVAQEQLRLILLTMDNVPLYVPFIVAVDLYASSRLMWCVNRMPSVGPPLGCMLVVRMRCAGASLVCAKGYPKGKAAGEL